MFESATPSALPSEQAAATLEPRHIRILLEYVFPTNEDLNAFFVDYFKNTSSQANGGMTRMQRTSLLIEREGHLVIAEILRDKFYTRLNQAIEQAKKGEHAEQVTGLCIAMFSQRTATVLPLEVRHKPNAANRLQTLEIKFRTNGTVWEYQKKLETQGEDNWNTLEIPSKSEDMILALFNPESNISDSEILKQSWRLRLRPADKFFRGSIPNLRHLTNLQIASTGMHLLYCGWTVCEMIHVPKEAVASGVIAVLGSVEFFEKINRLCRPHTKHISRDSVPSRSILVIERADDAADASLLHELALKASCPLIIWGGLAQPTRNPLVAEVITLEPTKEDQYAFMARLLARLLAGYDPEQAFANCLLSAPVEDVTTRWLRGAFDSWTIDVSIHGLRINPRWYMHIDRSIQENIVNMEIKRFSRKKNVNALVVFSCGSRSAGLDYFIRRNPAIAQSAGQRQEAALVADIELTWADDPGNQWQRLQQVLRSKKSIDIPADLVRRAQSVRDERGRVKGHQQLVLFVLRHDLASFVPSIDYRQVSLSSLQSYILQLNSIASGLVDQGVKLLIHIPIINATESDFSSIENYEYCHHIALSPLSEQIDDSELRDFLKQTKVRCENIETEINHMRGKTYDGLIQWLSQRFPELRTA